MDFQLSPCAENKVHLVCIHAQCRLFAKTIFVRLLRPQGRFGDTQWAMDNRRNHARIPLYSALRAGEYALDCDAARKVDTVFRRSAMTLRQIVQAFGPAALPETLREAARRNPDDRRNVIQAVYRREGSQQGQLDPARIDKAVMGGPA